MNTQYIPNPNVSGGVLRHNSRNWQVTELMGGLACELLFKERDVDSCEQKSAKLSLHACYPSTFLQGEAAAQFLEELAEAQLTCSNTEVDRLFLAEYRNSFN